MSRRRSKDPTTAISITLTRSILDKIDDSLTRTQSRSAWIASACQNKLQELQTSSIADANSRVLMAALTSREDIDSSLRHLLLQILSQ
jgi:metal-responsive CopG/Arc/MetJ family transcriptional regulator